MATSLLHNKSKDFWSDIRRIPGEKGTVSSTVGGFKSNRDVGNYSLRSILNYIIQYLMMLINYRR